MDLIALPAFTDNYIWLLHDGREALVVDPGDAAPVEGALQTLGLRLESILVTHHHADHTGGVDRLRSNFGARVFGAATESLPRPFVPVGEGSRFATLGMDIEVLDVPGHTAGHVAFVARPPGETAVLFSGDTLFSAGCGRLFEGTAAQMSDSLRRLSQLPGDTRVCCAHEYTLANLRFALAVEPDNQDAQQHAQACERARALSTPTLPSTMGLERKINPFLRCGLASVRSAAASRGLRTDDEVEVFTALREWKNGFR